jgi:hypothetical protein
LIFLCSRVVVALGLVFSQKYLPRGCGCSGHPAFPAPSVIGGRLTQQLGRIAPRECGRLPSLLFDN